MVRMKKSLMLTAGAVVLMVGCGGSATSTNESVIEPHKVIKSDIDVTSNGVISIEVTNDDKNYIFSYSSDDAYIQLYLDTDRNEESGYIHWGEGELGADFLIENNCLYKYAGMGGTDWTWEYIGVIGEQTDLYLAEVSLNSFGEDVNSFNLRAVSINENWEAISVKEDETVTKVIDMFYYLKQFRTRAISQDDLNLYFLDSDPLANQYHTHHFVNIDYDDSTGYQQQLMNISPTGSVGIIGAEYLIEDDKLYRYNGTGNDWAWEYVISLTRKTIDSSIHTDQFEGLDVMYTAIPKSYIPDWNAYCDFYIVYRDANWNMVEIASTEHFGVYFKAGDSNTSDSNSTKVTSAELVTMSSK